MFATGSCFYDSLKGECGMGRIRGDGMLKMRGSNLWLVEKGEVHGILWDTQKKDSSFVLEDIPHAGRESHQFETLSLCT